jgi:DNA-binding transcriptional ArsR family regulator
MDDRTDVLARAAAHMSDPSRAAMLWSLIGGKNRPASELAMLANVSLQTASNHLARLVKAGFVTVAPIGRNRFYRLNGSDVAAALESLAALGSRELRRSGSAQRSAPELIFARTCYDHLAGRLGVAIFERLCQDGYLESDGADLAVTAVGKSALGALGIDIPFACKSRRRFTHGCLDWSERVFHLGGALGAALLEWLLQEEALASSRGSRLLRLTDRGITLLKREFAISVSHKRELVAARQS